MLMLHLFGVLQRSQAALTRRTVSLPGVFGPSCIRRQSLNVEATYQKGELLEKYQQCIAAGTLIPDAQQLQCAERLSKLLDELHRYGRKLADHEDSLATYQEKRRRKRDVLKAAADKMATTKAETGAGYSSYSTASAWQQAIAWLQGSSSTSGETPRLNKQQSAVLAAAQREKQLDEILGPPAQPPTPPKGVYIYGQVGSGKSAVCDMFYRILEERSIVPLRRRMHFNSAMLEINSRIWGLEKIREQGGGHEEAEAAVAMLHARSSGAPVDSTSADDTNQVNIGLPSPADNAAAIAAAHGRGRGSSGSIVSDATRAARAARASQLKPKLAARRNRMTMLRRAPSAHVEALARSNAVVLTQAARALIRGTYCGNNPAIAPTTTEGSSETNNSMPAGGRQAALLYFDELQITDPFTAVSLKGVFEELVASGAALLVTSNRHPNQMTNHGLHEDIFDHFVKTLKESCDFVQLGSGTDYRKLALAAQGDRDPDSSLYLHPLTPKNKVILESKWSAARATADAAAASGGQVSGPVVLPLLFGRQIRIAAEQVAGDAVRFQFADLCKALMGSADYQAIAQRFRTVFLTDIPALSIQTRDQARRMITLVDELYLHQVHLICTAEVAPEHLFTNAAGGHQIDLEQLQFESAAEGGRLRRDVMARGGVAPVAASKGQAVQLQARLGGLEEQFAFQRAASRLAEMQTDAFLRLRQPVP